MDNAQNEKKAKVAGRSTQRGLLSVSKDTRKLAKQVLAKINKKDYGRNVSMDLLISTTVNLLQPEHITALQEKSLSNKNRLERDYRSYVSQHGPISMDDYLGKRLRNEIGADLEKNEE